MDVVSRPLRQPGSYLGVLVGGLIIHDEVNIELLQDTNVQAA